MTRAQFMNELRERLDRLPSDEREEALAYYEEYFDEAGVDHEQDVIRELGSPASVASRIYADRAVKAARASPHNPGKDCLRSGSSCWRFSRPPGTARDCRSYRSGYRHTRYNIRNRHRGDCASRRRPRHLYKRFRRPFLHARDGTGHVRRGIHFVGDRENHICDHGRGAFSHESVYLLAL